MCQRDLTTITLSAIHPDLVGDRSGLRPLDPQAALAKQLIERGARLANATIRYRVAAIAALHAPIPTTFLSEQARRRFGRPRERSRVESRPRASGCASGARTRCMSTHVNRTGSDPPLRLDPLLAGTMVLPPVGLLRTLRGTIRPARVRRLRRVVVGRVGAPVPGPLGPKLLAARCRQLLMTFLSLRRII